MDLRFSTRSARVCVFARFGIPPARAHFHIVQLCQTSLMRRARARARYPILRPELRCRRRRRRCSTRAIRVRSAFVKLSVCCAIRGALGRFEYRCQLRGRARRCQCSRARAAGSCEATREASRAAAWRLRFRSASRKHRELRNHSLRHLPSIRSAVPPLIAHRSEVTQRQCVLRV